MKYYYIVDLYIYLFSEMDDFLLMQRNVEYAEAEKIELEKKFQSHDTSIQKREAEIQRKIKAAGEHLSE